MIHSLSGGVLSDGGICFFAKVDVAGTPAWYLAPRRLEAGTRVVVPGHLQRGGSPSPYDRLLSTEMGSFAGHLANDGVFGVTVAMHGSQVTYNALADIAGKMKFVPKDDQRIAVARTIGISFGDDR